MRRLPEDVLPELASELRQLIIERVASNGGHLASNCGAVELTIALHRVFKTPDDRIFFDVGHQAYTHKLLTGRQAGFERLRKKDGVSGFPFPAESVFDPVPAGHAGSALSAALGAAAAEPDSPKKCIAVIGDGCIGCGETFEALNNVLSCAGSNRLIIVLNDNQMSISHNVGALSSYLNRIISGTAYNKLRSRFKKGLRRMPGMFNFVRSLVNGIKSAILPQGNFFGALGLRYLGPVDGHDLKKLIRTLERVNDIGGPVILHVVTRKGYGCTFAEKDPTRYHGIGKCDPVTGELPPAAPGFSSAFGEAMVKIASEDSRLVAVTAAMKEGTGLSAFAGRFPGRFFDAGIAEEHAVSFCCGLAASGKRPVCALYDTFLQRALDQLYHDVALAQLPVIFAVDRSGAVEDGPTHHGIYNCGFLRALPGVAVCAPPRCQDVEKYLRMALALDRPVVIRYPRGGTPPLEIPELDEPLIPGKAALIRRYPEEHILIWSFGAELFTALETADILAEKGIFSAVADARFLSDIDCEVARKYAGVPQFTIENHSLCGGLFSAVAGVLAGIPNRGLHGFGWTHDRIIPHGETTLLREDAGLTPPQIAAKIISML